MYSYMCIRLVRSYGQKKILSNCYSQLNYNYCHASYATSTYKGTSSNKSRYCSSHISDHQISLKSDVLPYASYCSPCFNVSVRNFSLTSILLEKEPLKPSSKVEETVQRLKDKEKDKIDVPAVEPPKAVVKKSLGQRIWAELIHYYHGFRLLFIDIRVSTGLVWRVLNGKSLTRREHNLLIRTVGDMFRLIPFSVFIIVPFMELTLPIFIKLFPGMLPSTFQTSSDRENKMKNSLKVKLEMARFLQKTLDEMAVQHNDRNSKSAKDFAEWFHKVRTSGQQVSNEDIMKFSKLFQDEITLDSLSRGQLIALCRVLEVQTLGTDMLLRFQLRMKLRSLKADDKLIQKEGVDSLNIYELQQACRARGMRAYGMPEDRLKQQLNQWLDLSLNKKVPPSLLLLSRALMLPEKIPTTDKLKATISVLPDSVVKHTKAAIAETEGKIDNKIKYEILKEEVRKVHEERQEHKEELKRKQKELMVDKAPILESKPSEELVDSPKITLEDPLTKKKEVHISTKDLGVIEDAIENLAKNKKKLIIEKEKIEDLKEEMADYQEDLNELKTMIADKPKPVIKESKAAKRLYNRVNNMIKKLDTVVKQLESKEIQLKQEMAGGESATLKEDVVRIDELLNAIRELQKVPNESVLQQIQNILGKMDDDHDGSIKVEDVLKVIQLIGKENVQLSAKQLDEVIDLLDKEEILEVEDKIEKALQKDKEQSDIKKKILDDLKITEELEKSREFKELEATVATSAGGDLKDCTQSLKSAKPHTATVSDNLKSSTSNEATCISHCTPKPSSKNENNAQTPLSIPPTVSIDQTKDKDKPSQL